jgi:hypothetical protein
MYPKELLAWLVFTVQPSCVVSLLRMSSWQAGQSRKEAMSWLCPLTAMGPLAQPTRLMCRRLPHQLRQPLQGRFSYSWVSFCFPAVLCQR